MALKANINNERVTNHSARKYIIQNLNDNEIPPTHIMPVYDLLPCRPFKPRTPSTKPPKESGRESKLRSPTQINL